MLKYWQTSQIHHILILFLGLHGQTQKFNYVLYFVFYLTQLKLKTGLKRKITPVKLMR